MSAALSVPAPSAFPSKQTSAYLMEHFNSSLIHLYYKSSDVQLTDISLWNSGQAWNVSLCLWSLLVSVSTRGKHLFKKKKKSGTIHNRKTVFGGFGGFFWLDLQVPPQPQFPQQIGQKQESERLLPRNPNDVFSFSPLQYRVYNCSQNACIYKLTSFYNLKLGNLPVQLGLYICLWDKQ